MFSVSNYRERYDALPVKLKKKALRLFLRWGCWSKQTVYNKLADDSVTPIERVLIEGVLNHCESQKALQLDLVFVWDDSSMSLKSDP